MNTQTLTQRKAIHEYNEARKQAIETAERVEFVAAKQQPVVGQFERVTDQSDAFERFQADAREILGAAWALWILGFIAMSLVSAWAMLLLVRALVSAIVGGAA